MKDNDEKTKAQVNVNLETTPIFYTDRIGITVNQYGVVLDVMQRLGNTNNVRIVSRIGMSQNHALKFSQELSKLLAIAVKSTSETNKKN